MWNSALSVDFLVCVSLWVYVSAKRTQIQRDIPIFKISQCGKIKFKNAALDQKVTERWGLWEMTVRSKFMNKNEGEIIFNANQTKYQRRDCGLIEN